jgi:Type I restriction modification DNA specificity domain
MIKLSELFDVKYGVNLELNALALDPNGINFVSRTAKNNGVSAKVKLIKNLEPIDAGVLTVAGGGSVLETFLQPEPFYSGRDLYYLAPLVPMTNTEKLYYCACIRANKYRYNYGRQANRTLKDILIPDTSEIPAWIKQADVDMYDGIDAPAISNNPAELQTDNWQPFEYQSLFNIERGRGPRRKDLDGSGSIPFVSSSDSNNGVTGITSMSPFHNGNTIGVNRNGSVGEAFYQPIPFCSTEDVHIFNPKFPLNPYIGLFLTTLIRCEKYRFGYGRKWGIERMKKSTIYLPVKTDNKPDWDFMEQYIKSLPYSSQIENTIFIK